MVSFLLQLKITSLFSKGQEPERWGQISWTPLNQIINNSKPISGNSICLWSFWHQLVSHERINWRRAALSGFHLGPRAVFKNDQPIDLPAQSLRRKRNRSDGKAVRQRAEHFNNAPKMEPSVLWRVVSSSVQQEDQRRGERENLGDLQDVSFFQTSKQHACSRRFLTLLAGRQSNVACGLKKKNLEISASFCHPLRRRGWIGFLHRERLKSYFAQLGFHTCCWNTVSSHRSNIRHTTANARRSQEQGASLFILFFLLPSSPIWRAD